MRKRASGRKPLPGFGIKGRKGKRGAMVRGFLEKGLVRIQWGRPRKIESWQDTPDNRALAIAFGEGVLEQLSAPTQAPAPTYEAHTLRQVWDKYALAEFDGLRIRTRDNYRKRWTKLELFKGRDFLAREVTRETLDEFRAELRKQEHEVNQIARHIEMVKRVFRWAVDRDVIPPTKVTTYRFKRLRDEKPLEIPEYSPAEATAILSQADPRDSRRWRPYVASYVLAFAGPRQNAALNLRWSDVDFDAATIRWRPEHDKLGKDRVQPVPVPVLDALWVAYGWAIAFGYEGEFVFFRPGAGTRDRGIRWKNKTAYVSARSLARAAAKPDKPWTYASYHGWLVEAEKAAKVKHQPYRAAHGFRRYVVNELLKKTGNLALAGQYIGDDDIRTLNRSYVRKRAEDLREVSDHMAGAAVATATPANRNVNAIDAKRGEKPASATSDQEA